MIKRVASWVSGKTKIALHVVVRWLWPIGLSTKFIVYAFTDDPTHFVVWHSSRFWHAVPFLVAAGLVIWTIGRTRFEWLITKAILVNALAISAIFGDLTINEPTSARWGSATSWFVIAIGNLIAVLVRLLWVNKDGKA